MKKTVIASVALTAALFAVSCQKETNPVQNVSGPMTISAVSEGLNTPTKTELAFKYDVLWSSTDKIYVVDSQGNNDTFKLEKGAGTTKGTFTQEGSTQFTGEVQAYYPATMLQSGSPLWPASQTNDQTIPMYCKKTLSGTTDERMDFASLGSVLQIVFNTTQENVTLKSIEIKDGSATLSGAFTVDTDGKAVITATDKAGITLDLGTGVALGKAANYFNIAVPAGDYQDLTLVFTATDGKKCIMTGGKVNIAYNAVGRLTLMGEKFKAYVPDGFVDLGVVVNSKPVYWATKNLGATNPEDYGNLYSWGNVDGQSGSSFTYEFSYANYDKTEGKNITSVAGWDKTKHDAAYKVDNVWRMPTADDFKELFKQCYAEWGTYNSVNGLIVYKAREGDASYAYFNSKMNQYSGSGNTWNPTDKTRPSYSTASDTFVFFPAAGYSYGTSRSKDSSRGTYWSSTWCSVASAYLLYFDSSSVTPQNTNDRYYGRSVRPVSD